MNIDKKLLINIFKTGIFFDKALMNRLGIKTENEQEMLNDIIKILEDIDTTELKKLNTEEEIRDFIIYELRKIDKKINNIVLIDRYTSQTLLKPFIVKGIFQGYTELQSREKILAKEKEKKQIEKFSLEEIREVLAKAGEYKYNGYYVRDFKNFVIGFSARIYIDYIKETEKDIKKEAKLLTKKEEENYIKETLRKLKLYKLAHKLAYTILGEVSIQRKSTNLEISKERLLNTLGYHTNEKQVYQDIKEAIFSLRWLEFVIWDYSKINRRAKKRDYADSITLGSFLNTLTEKEHCYIFDVNEKFVGCIQYIIENDAKGNKDKLNYFSYPLNNLSATKNYSNSAYFLTDFLIREMGNPRLNTQKHKIISYKISRYIKESNITNKHNTQKLNTFLKALDEIKIIEKTEPNIKCIKKLKPKKALETNLRIFIEKDVKILSQKLQCKDDNIE